MSRFTVVRAIAAPAEVVFRTIADSRRYPEFTPIRKAELEREGDEAPDGVGAIRALSIAGPAIREQVTDYEPPSLFRYRLLSGLPLRDHVGTVRIEPREGGATVRYTIETTPTIPLVGGAFVAALKLATNRLMGWVADRAEAEAAVPGSGSPSGAD